MSPNYIVAKCICHKRTFTEIKKYARRQGYENVQQLQNDNFCSCQCGMCKPYVELILETGETEFTPGAYLENS